MTYIFYHILFFNVKLFKETVCEKEIFGYLRKRKKMEQVRGREDQGHKKREVFKERVLR